MNIRGYMAKRLVYVIITLFAIIIFNFFLFRVMPGDPTAVLVPKTGDQELKDIIINKFHLNDPWYVQLPTYIGQVFTLDFGISTGVKKYGDVREILPSPITNTLLLVGIGTTLAIWMGVALGRAAAWKRGKATDTVGMGFALTFYSMPTFLFALVILMVFGGWLGWFPLNGAHGKLPFDPSPPDYDKMSILQKITSRGYHLVMPVIAFTIEMMAEYAIIMRNALTDVLTEDYITTARAKGISNKRILHDHAMRNAMLPVVTVAAISVGWVLGGDIMVEIVFSYEGLGLLTWDAVNKRDYPVLQAVFLLMAVGVLLANFVADIIYVYLDPRVSV